MLKKRRRRKKIIEISLLIIIIAWVSLFLIDYFRYQKSQKPLIIFEIKISEYADGSVTEYFSLGYVYRIYDRDAISKIEFKPLWTKIEVPEPLSPYPKIDDDYVVPNNPEKLARINNIMFFYDSNGNEVLHYRCLNSANDCKVAVTKNEPPNEAYAAEELAMYNKYVFIDDSTSDEKIIYIIDTDKDEIVYQTTEIIASKLASNGLATSDNGKFLVIDKNGKYGQIELGNEVVQVVPNNYDYIKYNQQSNTYTTQGKYWIVTDFTSNYYVATTPIEDVYLITNNYYIKTIKEEKINNQTVKFYKLLDTDHTPIFTEDLLSINNYNNDFIVVDKFLKISIRDTKNNELTTEEINILINPITSTETPFIYEEIDNELVITVYHPGGQTVNKYYLNNQTYKINKTDLNITNK